MMDQPSLIRRTNYSECYQPSYTFCLSIMKTNETSSVHLHLRSTNVRNIFQYFTHKITVKTIARRMQTRWSGIFENNFCGLYFVVFIGPVFAKFTYKATTGVPKKSSFYIVCHFFVLMRRKHRSLLVFVIYYIIPVCCCEIGFCIRVTIDRLSIETGVLVT